MKKLISGNTIPEEAEKFLRGNFEFQKMLDSRWIPGRKLTVRELHCPYCNERLPLEVGERGKCECGLIVDVGEKHLHIWRNVPARRRRAVSSEEAPESALYLRINPGSDKASTPPDYVPYETFKKVYERLESLMSLLNMKRVSGEPPYQLVLDHELDRATNILRKFDKYGRRTEV